MTLTSPAPAQLTPTRPGLTSLPPDQLETVLDLPACGWSCRGNPLDLAALRRCLNAHLPFDEQDDPAHLTD